jgi:hypothetical protein
MQNKLGFGRALSKQRPFGRIAKAGVWACLYSYLETTIYGLIVRGFGDSGDFGKNEC